MVEEGGIFRFGAEVAVIGVEQGIEAEDRGQVELGPSKDAEGGPRSGAQTGTPGEEQSRSDDPAVGEIKGVPGQFGGADGEVGGDEGLGGASHGPKPSQFKGEGMPGEQGDHPGERGPVAEVKREEFEPGFLLMGGEVAQADQLVEDQSQGEGVANGGEQGWLPPDRDCKQSGHQQGEE